jgi:hypothetical protein
LLKMRHTRLRLLCRLTGDLPKFLIGSHG